jgi:hypothetical protein
VKYGTDAARWLNSNLKVRLTFAFGISFGLAEAGKLPEATPIKWLFALSGRKNLETHRLYDKTSRKNLPYEIYPILGERSKSLINLLTIGEPEFFFVLQRIRFVPLSLR